MVHWNQLITIQAVLCNMCIADVDIATMLKILCCAAFVQTCRFCPEPVCCFPSSTAEWQLNHPDLLSLGLSAPAQHSILPDTWLCVDKAQNCTRVNDCLQLFMYIKLLDTNETLALQLETYGQNENLIIHHMTLMLSPSKANSNIAVHPWWYWYQCNSIHLFVTQTGTYSSPSKSLEIHMQIPKTETVFPWLLFIWSLKAGPCFYW